MKLTMKQKVVKVLRKWGWNEETANEWVEGKEYKYAVKNYSTPAKIANCLINL